MRRRGNKRKTRKEMTQRRETMRRKEGQDDKKERG